MQEDKIQNAPSRVIGFDSHPDTFTSAVITGSTPSAAVVEKTFDKVPIAQLKRWAQKHTKPGDVIVLEASGNSFHIARQLQSLSRQVKVLESCHLGKLKDAHANNDAISAVRIGKAFLSGTARVVWIPDTKTQERRDWFHAHKKAVRATTRARNSLLSYLSDNGVRLPKGTRLATNPAKAEQTLRSLKDWSPQQWQVLQIMLLDLHHAEEQRAKWRSLIGQEVASDPMLLSLMRLCGVRVLVAFAIGAIIGDIKRFASPKALVKYLGLNPAFDSSGKNDWRGGIGYRGRGDLRALLMESAQAVMRATHPLAKWGRKLMARKGTLNLVVAAVARKLTVAIWYLMNGRWTPITEVDSRLQVKVGRLITTIGPIPLQAMGMTRLELRQKLSERLLSGRSYQLKPPVAIANAPA